VGDVASMVAEPNAPFIVTPGDNRALAGALERLAADASLRQAIGVANQTRARKEFEETRMIERYKALYWGLMGRSFA
jgi:glycosyltransferase involved in cell wall biosynthesis